MSRASWPSAFLAVAIAVTAQCLCGPAAAAAERWTWPVDGPVITPYRNGDDPYAGGQHRGIDVASPVGTPVLAAAGGTVRFAGVAGSSGLTVSLRTSDGRLDTSYLHLVSVDVREGDRVGAGRRLGAVGTSGRRSTARPHLHFGVREAGSRHAYRDPLDFLPPIAPRPVPRGGPAPVSAPVRVPPASERVRTPSPARRPAPARRRVRVPAGRRIPTPAGRRIPAPVVSRAPRALARLGSATAPRALPAPAGGHARPAPAPAPSPVAGPRPLPAGQSQLTSQESRRPPAPVAEGGPDLGWALACAALLLAAACLGRPDASASGSRKRPQAVWSWLRPLLGRR